MNRKATFILNEQVMLQAKEVVEKVFFKSMNAFVDSAIRDEIAKIKKEEIRRAIAAAGKDPLFLSDIREIENDFKYADFDA